VLAADSRECLRSPVEGGIFMKRIRAMPLIIAIMLMVASPALPGMSGQAFLELCVGGDPERVRSAIGAGADVNATFESGVTVLMSALNNGARPDVLRVLLEAGADVHARTSNGATPLFYAVVAEKPNLEAIRLLLEFKADMNVKMASDITPLMAASAKTGNPEVIALLLEAGADTQATSRNGRTAADFAERNPKLKDSAVFEQLREVPDPLLSPKIAMAAEDVYFFVDFCREATPSEIEAAIGAGADANAPGDYEVTPLAAAASNPHPGAVVVLLKAGADVNERSEAGETALIHAAQSNANPEVVEALLKAGADPNATDISGGTALSRAFSRRDTAVMLALLKGGAKTGAENESAMASLVLAALASDMSALDSLLKNKSNVNLRDRDLRDRDGKSVLMYGARNPDTQAVERLLKAGADVDATDKERRTVLMVAAEFNPEPEIFGILVHAGADVKKRDSEGRTALMLAAENASSPETLSMLIEAGADVHEKSRNGQTPLMWAATRNPNPEIHRLLLKSGADLDPETSEGSPSTPLMQAAGYNTNPEVVKLLIAAGADVNARGGGDGRTPLMYAASNGNMESERVLETVRMLLDAGADPGVSNRDGLTALHLAAWLVPSPDVIGALLRAGANVEAWDGFLGTPLMVAAEHNLPSVVALLLEAGADVDAKNESGETALAKAAAANPSAEAISLLLNAGARVETKADGGRTPLMSAVYNYRNPDAVPLLLKAGADVNARDDQGITALHIAIEKAFSKIGLQNVAHLLKAGAKVDARDGEGRTPLLHAASNSWNPKTPELMNLLLQNGADVNSKDKNGWTPLLFALKENENPETARTLLKAGAEPYVDKRGVIPFLMAFARISNPDVVMMLLESATVSKGIALPIPSPRGLMASLVKAGVDVRSLRPGFTLPPEIKDTLLESGLDTSSSSLRLTPLMLAAAFSPDADMLKTLIKSGADPNEKSEYGLNPLVLAILFKRNPEIVNALIEGGADVRNSSLHMPSFSEMMRALVNAGVPHRLFPGGAFRHEEGLAVAKAIIAMNTQPIRITPLMMAAVSNPNVLETLIKAGANANESGTYGVTPLMYAAALGRNRNSVIPLLKAGANPNAVSDHGATPLMLAAAFNAKTDVLKALFDGGADLNWSAWYVPSLWDIVHAFEKAGGNVHSRSPGPKDIALAMEVGPELLKIGARREPGALRISPLMVAAVSNRNPDVVSLLIKNGANPDEDFFSMTPLMLAASIGKNPANITALLKGGANAKVRNFGGERALDFAAKNPALRGTQAYRELQQASR